MPEAVKAVLLIVSALFPIVNPLGGSPIFLALTEQYPAPARHAVSRRIAINSFFLIVGAYLIGTHVLAFFGISLPVVQVAGGLVVIAASWKMLQQREGANEKAHNRHATPSDLEHSAFYPLTMPLTVGPGSISVAVTLGANAPRAAFSDWVAVAAALIGAALIALSVFLCYRFADRLARVLGPTGMSVFLRLTSFLLLCIGVQILWNGASALLKGL